MRVEAHGSNLHYFILFYFIFLKQVQKEMYCTEMQEMV